MKLPRLLVLRIWNEPERYRAVVRELEPDRTRVFGDPDALIAFLREGTAVDAPATGHGPGADSIGPGAKDE